jgi:hypothetical protein
MRRPHTGSLFLLLSLLGCHTWQGRDVANLRPAPAPIVFSGLYPVRVTRPDGSKIVIKRAEVVGDSIVGEVGTRPRGAVVAVSDVRHLEEQRTSSTRTFLLVPAVLLGTLAALIAAAAVNVYTS